MVNLWKDPPPKDEEPLKDFLELFDLGREGKTSNLLKLKLKLGGMWGGYTKEVRKAYSDVLAERGRLDEETCYVLKIFGGTIADIKRVVTVLGE